MTPQRLLKSTYLFYFFLGLHGYLFIYLNSSILSEQIPERMVGLLFTLGAAISIPILLFLPKFLKRFGDVRSTLVALVLEGIALFTLVYSTIPIVVALAFLLHFVLIRVLFLDTDVLAETSSVDADTGSIRGTLLTVGNSAFLFAPIIAGFLLGDTNDYTRIFVASMFALVPAFLVLLTSFKHFKDPKYVHIEILPTIKEMFANESVRLVFTAGFLLRIYYAVMTIYLGLYLHLHLLMPWKEIGIVFTVMLLPFAILEYPLGRLADTKYGEKEMMLIGFVLAAVVTAFIPWVTTTSVVFWSLFMLATRIGVATVEIMTETYFFKHVDAENVETISLYRIVDPAAYLVAPFVGSILLIFVDTKFIFLALAIVTLLGAWPAWKLRDTR